MTNADGRNGRHNFDQGVRIHMTAIDGSWRRDCIMGEVSQTGARLTVSEAVDGLDLKEFLLLLTPTGIVSRRCELVRADGHELQVRFLVGNERKPPSR